MSDVAGLDLERLAVWFGAHVPGADGELTARIIAAGKSNLTYEVGDGTMTWIVRRPPLGHVLATAHDMAREYRVMAALRHTEVPVPEIDILATLHAIDPATVGLADFGRPEGYLARQVERWRKQLCASHSRDLRPPTSSTPGSPPTCRRSLRPASCTATTGSTTLWWDRRQDSRCRRLGDGHPRRPLAGLALMLTYQRLAYLQGQTVGEGFGTIGDVIRPLLDAGLAVVDDD